MKLGLEDHQISDIKENNRHDVEKQRQKALAMWKQQSSFMGTYRRLIEVLLEVKRNDHGPIYLQSCKKLSSNRNVSSSFLYNLTLFL